MYRTKIDCTAAGPFAGKMVVSMRPFRASDAIRAIQICTRFPAVHGAPVHLGDPALIGIADLAQPDYGDAVRIGEHGNPAVLGLRGDAAGGAGSGQAAARHHPQPRVYAGH